MRFDDRIGTVLAQPEEDSSARRLKLRQLLDLLAQGLHSFTREERSQALAYLQQIESSLDGEERERVRALAELCTAGGEETLRHPDPVPVAGEAAPPASYFVFETDGSGTITVVDEAPREALIGLSISAVPDEGGWGFSASVAKAFKRKVGFRNAGLRVPGNGAASGQWCVSAVPFFDRRRDTFLGYRGTARRPFGDEVSSLPRQSNPDALFNAKMPADSMRQLVHEIRTPLNAIAGFAEMIDNQLLGPTAEDYRHRAQSIRAEVERLLSAVEDLDTAAQVDDKAPAVADKSVNLAQIVSRKAADEPKVIFSASQPLPEAMLDTDAADKIVGKMLTFALGLVCAGEKVNIELSPSEHGGSQSLKISRPASLQGCSESELLDPGFAPEGEALVTPALGVGFTLRLIRNMLRASGGALSVHPDQFELCFPSAPAG